MTDQHDGLCDPYGRRHTYLRISVTDRCNLRCTYCMPSQGIEKVPSSTLLSIEEIARLGQIFAGMGIRKIRITGGEPLVRRGLAELVRMLSQTQGIDTVSITTNGVLLCEFAKSLRNAGLSGLNVSLDTLRQDRFMQIARRPGLDDVLAGIDAALEAGFPSVKINMVVMRGVNDDELANFAELARHRPLHVRFIEFMPFTANDWEMERLLPYGQMIERLQKVYSLHRIDDANSESTAIHYAVDGWRGSIGFIASMTHSFCGKCNRLRLLSDGLLKSCLFRPPSVNLRDCLRNGLSDEEIREEIRCCVNAKSREHPPVEELANRATQLMARIGG